ncbi:MAG TPA: hypothetical protein VFU62_05385 [Hanamia sp.]|nr:hypothetical protein [Hanamia sp.]
MKYLIFAFALIFFSCKKDSITTSPDASLYTNVDTLSFDTVFTTAGSVTQSFKIFNNNNEKLRLSQVKLSGGNSSPFKMNVDGAFAAEIDNIEINANDSIYVFVQVNAQTSDSTLPFILNDSIQILYNGNKKIVQLQAYGQNAIFLKNKKITGNMIWNNKLPYVIIGGIQIDTNAALNISAGTKIFLHADAPFLVDGTLHATGTKNEPVIFSGDRLDNDYKNLPASWPGLFFRNTSENNSLKHTIIKNAYQGIIAQNLSTTTQPKVTISQCILDNIYDAGIFGINTNIYADNSLISNCGSNLQLQAGGDYRFINCTIVSYNTIYIIHKNPVLQLSNSIIQNGSSFTAPLNAFFQNCIFWGDGGTVDNEISIDKQGATSFTVSFDHVLYKAKNDISNATFVSSIKNENPMFDSINISKNIFDFHFNNNPASPAVNAGETTPFLYDLDDKKRDQKPDIGCYER